MLNSKVLNRRVRAPGPQKQAGLTLVEAMISLALSLVVTTSMVTLMGNSMGSATRIIQMSQLTDELRNAMSMMSRDVRRANFNPNSIYCYANSDCGADGSATQSANIFVNADENCLLFNLDRNWDGDASTDNAGGFRLTENDVGVGFVEMWVGDFSPNCGPGDGWIPVTDPGFVNVTVFEVDTDDSFSGEVESGAGTLTQTTRVISMRIRGELLLDSSINREIHDTIRVRNDFFL